MTASTTAISMRSARRCASVSSSSAPVTAATVAGHGGVGAQTPARAQAVEERAAHQHPDRLAQPGDVVDGFGERQPHVVVAVVALDPQLHAVAVQAERADPAAAQRRGQAAGEPFDDVAVRGLHVLKPA